MAKKTSKTPASPGFSNVVNVTANVTRAAPITEHAMRRRYALVTLDLIDWKHDREFLGDGMSKGTEAGNESMEALAESIVANGVETPIEVEVKDNGRYQVIAGRRRCEASRLAGLAEVPCMVYENVPPGFSELRSFRENILRKNLTPYEVVAKVSALHDLAFATAQIADECGMSERHVANLLRVGRKLIPEGRERLRQGILALKDAIAMASKDREAQLAMIAGEKPTPGSRPLAAPPPAAPINPVAPGNAPLFALEPVSTDPADYDGREPPVVGAAPSSGPVDSTQGDVDWLLEGFADMFPGSVSWRENLATLAFHPYFNQKFTRTVMVIVKQAMAESGAELSAYLENKATVDASETPPFVAPPFQE